MAEVKTMERMRMRRFESVRDLIDKTRAIRRRISAASGRWDAARVLRAIRYAK